MYPKDTEKWKQFTTITHELEQVKRLLCIPKILKNESNSQPLVFPDRVYWGCCVSQRYWKMKAIHNYPKVLPSSTKVVVYPKDTEKWKQFTTYKEHLPRVRRLLCIPKILKNESNSQRVEDNFTWNDSCCVSQRYWKMKAIHNHAEVFATESNVVVYPKDTEKWKQFTTIMTFIV